MTLPAPLFREMAEQVWGPSWPDILARRLRQTVATVRKWGTDGVPADFRAAVESAVEDQLALVARYHHVLQEG